MFAQTSRNIAHPGSCRRPLIPFLILALMLALATTASAGAAAQGIWLSGDFHNHTVMTDGSYTERDVFSHALGSNGLDWIANSEHGGAHSRNPEGIGWTDLTPQPLRLADPPEGRMWRWQELRDYSFPLLQSLRRDYPGRIIIQGYEWDVPGHDQASVGVVGVSTGIPIARHEYLFGSAPDSPVTDRELGLPGKPALTGHAQAIEGVRWLQEHYPGRGYVLINHPSRRLQWSIQDLRDLNDAAPDVCFGMEAMPGHHKASSRGGYSGADPREHTYGGADVMLAEVGGLWDALLAEGRHFWAYANSDFHNAAGDDHYPGAYDKTWVMVRERTAKGVLDGLRSGNSFCVHGDLIRSLGFAVRTPEADVTMGGTATAKGGQATVEISFASPDRNNHGDSPRLDHIDLIMGEVTGKAADTNPTARVIRTFYRGDWGGDARSGHISFALPTLTTRVYLRLRGTNVAVSTPGETDADGDPLIDAEGKNTEAIAWSDLWFYSNPIFVNPS